jgi:DNA-binding MurR/RpiR family transcriptional regulator
VVFDFFRYRRQVASAARILADSGAAVVAVTDSPLSPLVELADTWCEIEVPAVGPFDSSVPVVAIAELLVARVARDLQEEATARIDRIEALWEETEVFL